MTISRDLLHCWRCSYSKEANTQEEGWIYRWLHPV